MLARVSARPGVFAKGPETLRSPADSDYVYQDLGTPAVLAIALWQFWQPSTARLGLPRSACADRGVLCRASCQREPRCRCAFWFLSIGGGAIPRSLLAKTLEQRCRSQMWREPDGRFLSPAGSARLCDLPVQPLAIALSACSAARAIWPLQTTQR